MKKVRKLNVKTVVFLSGKSGYYHSEPSWNWAQCYYRVKEEPKYRPYENTEEMIEDFCERSGAKRSKMDEPFIWVFRKNGDFIVQIVGFYHGASGDFVGIHFGNSVETLSLEELFYNYTFKDGGPCGKEIN